MKHSIVQLALLLLISPVLLFPQQLIINDFEQTDVQQWLFVNTVNADSQLSYIRMEIDSSLKMQGDASLDLEWSVDQCEDFGGLSRLEYWLPGDSLMPWKNYDTLSFWINNRTKASSSGKSEFRFLAFDVSDSPQDNQSQHADSCEVYYSFHYILDDDAGWQQIKIPLQQANDFGEPGFYRPDWSGIAGNQSFDRDFIKGFALEFFVSSTTDSDAVSGQLNLDQMFVFTKRERNDFLFNGMSLGSGIELGYSGDDGAVEISEQNPYSGSKSLKWTTSKTELYSGPVFHLQEPLDYIYHWQMNPLHFKLRMGEGQCDIRILISDDDTDGDGPDRPFAAEYIIPKPMLNPHGTWKEYQIPLSNFNRYAGFDNGEYIEPGIMDSCRISSIQFQIADSAGLNHTFFLDDIVLGTFPDDGKPKQPQFMVATVPENYQNVISWTDSYEGDEETYSIYYSEFSINKFNFKTDEVEVAADGLTQENCFYWHDLLVPLKDTPVSYYYAVTVVDGYGVESDPVDCLLVESMAKGSAVIYFNADFNFKADGNLDEWNPFKPFRMYPSDGSGTVVDETEIDGDADLCAEMRLACDAQYLYAAFDVSDDSLVFTDGEDNPWNFDCVHLYIGLYDAHYPQHNELQRGSEPDFLLLFNDTGIEFMNPSGHKILGTSIDYHFGAADRQRYIIEAKIPFDSLTAYQQDSVFVPFHEMHIPLDFSINDRDAGSDREGILTYSRYNNDLSWKDVGRWSHTWVWQTPTSLEEHNSPAEKGYRLYQNFPNPFNPGTHIQFNIPRSGHVSIVIYNTRGQVVETLLNEYRRAGMHDIQYDSGNLPSGVYFYRIKAGNFSQTKKMIAIH